ncbi:MlaD family protein [Nocardia sp. XZ_19_385]|uniref:MlaD family protein n=1 Tax=Nocardia sp. XZ_19_385 TaxID=2769488 RepID=UPI00188DF73C|nr:MlaD family protein [Nocardia sp. XZ_19_385]
MTKRSVFSLGAIVLVLISGISYPGFGVLKMDPFADHITATMTLPEAGGVGVGTPVLLSGIEVGAVTAVGKTAAGIEIALRLDDSPRIPTASTVRIENLSALGEPYIEFEPIKDTAPYISDNQRIDAASVQLPMTIPEVSVRVVEVLDQLDPKIISALVQTVDTATTGTENEIPRLEHASKLLAATILSRTDTIRQLLIDLQTIGGDMAWAGPALTAGGPEWADIGARLTHAITVTTRSFDKGIQPGDFLQPDGLVPFLHDLTAYLEKIGPRTAAQLPALRPLFDASRNAAGQLDLGVLITQALNTVSPDGTVRLRINVK